MLAPLSMTTQRLFVVTTQSHGRKDTESTLQWTGCEDRFIGND
jgi:hypothetical protein